MLHCTRSLAHSLALGTVNNSMAIYSVIFSILAHSALAFCFRSPNLASDGRILLWTAVFCFGGQRFASHGRDCLWITAQSFKEKHFALCNAQFALTLQKDVMDPYYNEMCLFARRGCYSTFSPRVSHFFERPYVMYFHELCQSRHCIQLGELRPIRLPFTKTGTVKKHQS